jgi:hypothetical protein
VLSRRTGLSTTAKEPSIVRARPLATLLLCAGVSACPNAADGPAPAATTTGDGASSDLTTGPPPTSTSPSTSPPGASTSTTDAASTSGPDAEVGGEASGEASGDLGPPPSCGDGVVDPGETCDLGHGQNADFGPCTLACQHNTCGDGLVWAGVEACDPGPDPNDQEYGGCTADCELGPHCGDGDLQGPEQCDLGEDNGSGDNPPDSLPCTETCHFDGLLVFLTSETFTPAELGGPAGADLLCQTAAADAGLDAAGNFWAWLNHGYMGPADLDRLSPDQPYALLSGHRVADHGNQLLVTGPLRGITMTEVGETIYKALVWTGTASDGLAYNDDLDCDDWSAADPLLQGRVGNSGPDKTVDPAAWQTWKAEGRWTSSATFLCTFEYRLYCFES